MALDLLIDEDTGEVTDTTYDSVDSPKLSLAQRLKVRLSTFKGEMYTDEDYGIDYYGVVFTKTFDQQAVDLAFRTEILKEDDVSSIQSITYDFDTSTRSLSITFIVIEESTDEAVEITL